MSQISQETPVLGSIFNKVAGLKACNVIKKRLQHRCLRVKFSKLLRRTFFIEHLRWMLLNEIHVDKNCSVKDLEIQWVEAVTQTCSVKKVFLEISQNPQEYTCVRVSRLWHRCFPVNFVKFLRTPFLIEHLWWLLLSEVSGVVEAIWNLR